MNYDGGEYDAVEARGGVPLGRSVSHPIVLVDQDKSDVSDRMPAIWKKRNTKSNSFIFSGRGVSGHGGSSHGSSGGF